MHACAYLFHYSWYYHFLFFILGDQNADNSVTSTRSRSSPIVSNPRRPHATTPTITSSPRHSSSSSSSSSSSPHSSPTLSSRESWEGRGRSRSPRRQLPEVPNNGSSGNGKGQGSPTGQSLKRSNAQKRTSFERRPRISSGPVISTL